MLAHDKNTATPLSVSDYIPIKKAPKHRAVEGMDKRVIMHYALRNNNCSEAR